MLPPPPVRHHDLHPHNRRTASCFPTSAMLQREARSFTNTYPPSSKENQAKRSRRNNTIQVAARERPFYREQEFLKNRPNRQTRHLVYFVRRGSHCWIYQYRLYSIVWVLRMFDWLSTQHFRVVGRRGLCQRKVTVNYYNKYKHDVLQYISSSS